jgi:HEAT repeat protein
MPRLQMGIALLSLLLLATGCGRPVYYPEKGPSAAATEPDPENPSIGGRTLKGWMTTLKHDKDPGERWNAVNVIADLEPRFAVPPLIEALKDSDAKVRRTAARALGKFGKGAKNALPPLIAALNDSDDMVKLMAADAVGNFGFEAKAAIPALTAMYKSPNGDLRANAANALKRIDNEAARAAGVPDPN